MTICIYLEDIILLGRKVEKKIYKQIVCENASTF